MAIYVDGIKFQPGASSFGSSTDYSRFESDGTLAAHGEATYWNDIYVFPDTLDEATPNPPTRKFFQNNGEPNTDNGIKMYDTRAAMTGYVAANTPLNNGVYTVEFWVKPTTVNLDLVSFGGQNKLRINNKGKILSNIGQAKVAQVFLNVGAWNHVTAVVDAVTSKTATFYVNDTAPVNVSVSDPNLAGTYYLGDVDAEIDWDLITVYDVLLNASQAAERWNDGLGTFSLPSGILDSDRVLYCDVEQTSGTNLTNTKGNDWVVQGVEDTNFEWSIGAVGGPGTTGVFLKAFEPGRNQYVGLNISPPHSWKVGSTMYPHIHFSFITPPEAGQTITWNFEYTVTAIDSTFPVTVVAAGTYTATGDESPRQHIFLSMLPNVNMSTIGTISPHLVGTLSRGEDTFPHDVFLLNEGTHHELDMMGSRETLVK